MILTPAQLTGSQVDPFSILSHNDRDALLRAAETDVSILLLGETGTGKGQLARAIAARSFRRGLVEVNCAALPDELLGSELFGHKRGAFTGAISDRKGILVAAAGKTVFLDEIGEISPNMQRMLLRVLQRSNRSLKPLGADDEIPLPPLRFIFATNRDLEAEAHAGRFREDLLRRIDVVTVELAPLRMRPDLIQGYTGRFLSELAALHKIKLDGIDRRALDMLKKHQWPGNIRELKNVLERAIVTAPRGDRDKAIGVVLRKENFRLSRGLAGATAKNDLVKVEGDAVRNALALTKGNVVETMKILGLSSRSSLSNRMKKHGITFEKRMK